MPDTHEHSGTRTAREQRLEAWLRAARRSFSLAERREPRELRRLAMTPRLAALKRAGTRHVYVDSADAGEIESLVRVEAGVQREELDGNTANQPLVRKVIERGLDREAVSRWVRALHEAVPAAAPAERAPWTYALLCAFLGRDVVERCDAGRGWETSLQLHMGLAADPVAAVRVGQLLEALVPGVFVKVPFAPDAPQSLLVARELRRRGIRVNLTSTFSARQVLVGALLAEADRTNVFLGRLDQGLEAERLGEHVVLAAQRALASARQDERVSSQLIAASLRDWRSIPRLAGCDAYTVPPRVLRDYLEQDESASDSIGDAVSRTEAAAESVRVDAGVERRLGRDAIARLHWIEPGLQDFLRRYRASDAWSGLDLEDGAGLAAEFESAGFGDLFHTPTGDEREELREGKLPKMDGVLVGRVALDTHYSLLANADFAVHQEAIDARLAAATGRKGEPEAGRA